MYDEQKVTEVREGLACIFYDEGANELLDLRELVKYIFPNDPSFPQGLLIIGNSLSLHNHDGGANYTQYNSLEEFLENKV